MDVQKMSNVPSLSPHQSFKIMLITNIIVTPYFEKKICDTFVNENDCVEVFIKNNVEFIDETIESIQPVNLVIILLNFENLYSNVYNDIVVDRKVEEKIVTGEIENYKYIISSIRKKTNVPIIWFGYEDYCYFECWNAVGHIPIANRLVDQVNFVLCQALDGIATFVDLKILISKIGISAAYDRRKKYLWNAPYSKALIEAIVKEIHKQYLIEMGNTKKCLVVDCDNVLWGGILSEDGIENLKLGGIGLGRVYQDFQRFILLLHYHGVIVTLCSKNNLSDVLTIFREHSGMVLKESHIACFQVNWKDKPSNILKIAKKLNIGLESMVFVDDSPIEIEAVKTMLPEVVTILFKRELDYTLFSCFNLKNNVNLADIEKRIVTYHTNEKRDEFKGKFSNYNEYVRALNVKTEIHKIVSTEYSRVSELTQRTNKCTNGSRFTVQEIKDCIENEGLDFYTVHVSDRFSDLGLVGTFAVNDNKLILFSLSCRALGRGVEQIMLEYIMSHWNIKKILFHPTMKNASLRAIFEETVHPVFTE